MNLQGTATKRHLIWAYLLRGGLLAAYSLSAYAQTATADILGKVFDPANAAVARAKVTATNLVSRAE
jgi:hypothetical protein